MHGTRQNWNSVWQGSLWQPHHPHDQPAPPGWCRIDPRQGAAATRVPAAFREDSRPQAILKFYWLSSLDYRASHEPRIPDFSRISVRNWFSSKICFFKDIFFCRVRLNKQNQKKKKNLFNLNFLDFKTLLLNLNRFFNSKGLYSELLIKTLHIEY